MQALDQTIAQVALPHMQSSLQADRNEVTWILTSYIVAMAIMAPSTGWLASRLGEKKLFLMSLIGFSAASALCGAAQTLDDMIVFRLIQGLSGAGLSPLSQAIIISKFPIEKRPKILGIWASIAMLAPILGPTLGGWLTESYSWRWVFYINVPVGILSVAGIWFCLKQGRTRSVSKFDTFSFTMVGLALGSLQLVLDRGASLGWFESPEIVLETVVCCVALYFFIVQLFTTGSTLFPEGLFRDRNFLSGSLVTFVFSGLIITSSAMLPLYLQTLGGYPVFNAGVLLAPRGLGTLMSIVIVGRAATRVDPRHFILLGSLVAIVTFWEMANWTPDVGPGTVIVISVIQGFGMGLVFIPCNVMSFSTLPGAYRTDGAAFISVARSMGGAIGVSLTSTIVSRYTSVVHAQIAEQVTPFNRVLWMDAPVLWWNPAIPFSAEALDGVMTRSAEIVAYSDAFLMMFVLGLLAPVIALGMRHPAGFNRR